MYFIKIRILNILKKSYNTCKVLKVRMLHVFYAKYFTAMIEMARLISH